MLNIIVNILPCAGLEIHYRGLDNSPQSHCKYSSTPFVACCSPFLYGKAKVLLLIVRDKAQSVEEYRAKRRFKQGGQK